MYAYACIYISVSFSLSLSLAIFVFVSVGTVGTSRQRAELLLIMKEVPHAVNLPAQLPKTQQKLKMPPILRLPRLPPLPLAIFCLACPGQHVDIPQFGLQVLNA